MTTVTTRLPVGEIDRGTIDLLLGFPVSRWHVYTSHSLVWACSGLSLFVFGLAGNWIGSALADSAMAEPRRPERRRENGTANPPEMSLVAFPLEFNEDVSIDLNGFSTDTLVGKRRARYA